MRLRVSDRAQADVVLIAIEGSRRSGATTAGAIVERMHRTIESTLVEFPRSGRLRPEFGPAVRSFPVTPYVLFYRESKDTLTILRILHGHRDIKEPLMSLLLTS